MKKDTMQRFQFRFQSVTIGWPQIPKNRIIDYTMYRLVEKIVDIISYVPFVLVHEKT